MGEFFHQMAGRNRIGHKSFKNMEAVIGFEKTVTTEAQIFIYICKKS